MGALSSIFGSSLGTQATLLNFLWNWGFWSKEPETDYYASLEDGEAYISLTQKDQ